MVRLALALLLLASPALAGRVAVIRQHSKISNESEFAASKALSAVTSRLDLLGVDYDVLPQQALVYSGSSPSLRSGTVYFTPSYSRQYVGMIHMGFGVNTAARATGFNPESLTRADSTWSSIPHIFFGPQTIAGSIFSSSASCSTGVSGSATIGASLHNSNEISFHAPGYDYAFKVGAIATSTITSLFYHENGANSITRTSTQHGITKARLVAGASAMAFNDNGNSSATWPDSVGRASSYFTGADTMALWTRERFSGDPDPLIFATLWNVSNGGANNADVIVDMAVALMDSATGGQVIGQREGWSPPTIAFVVSGAFTRSVSSDAAWDAHGTQCATRCDTALVKAGIDSLKSLRIPLTVTVNVDSVASYPYEKAWWSGISGARFSPEVRAGTGTNLTGAAQLSGPFLSPDLFGYRRTRTLGTYDQLAGTDTDCDDTDTSLVCMLKRTRIRLDSIPEFKGRASRFLLAPTSDYLHAGITRASTPGEDTLVSAFQRAGYTCAGIDIMYGQGGMASFWRYAGGNQSPGTGAPSSFNIRQRKVRSAFGNDDFRWLAFRGIDETNVGSAYDVHPMDAEFYAGTAGTVPWYRTDLPYWTHNFRTKLSLFVVKPGDLGFQASATANPVRPGYHQIRWLVSQVRLVNHFAGRTVINIGYPEDIEP